SKQWGLASAGGYGPLMLSRVSRALSMVAYGAVDGSWQDDANRSLDLFAVRYVVLPRTAILDDSGPNAGGVQWSGGELGIDLGPGCGTPNPDSYTVELPAPVSATRLGVVSALACAAGVGDGTEVVRVSLEDTAGRISEQTLAAGRDTSEWAYDCADVRPVVKHQRAPVFRSYETTREPAPCEGHDYLSELAFDVARPIKSVRFTWVGPAGAWALKKISLFDEPAGRSYPVTQVAHAPADAARWRYVGDTEGGIVYENLRAMPRAWLVPEVVSVSEEEALAAIRTSRLPGGDTFDPARTALVEGPVPFNAQGFDPAAGAKVIKASGDTVEVRTSSATASFLVLSDVHYPGWRAFVDGVAAPLLQADYALRGVPLPPGAHTVRLEFKPVTFYYGAAVSAASLVALMAFTFFYRRRASDTPDNANSNDSSRP
ncbi:MAG: YfhO family protein, partial [Pyrinomonadaceae bacterium]